MEAAVAIVSSGASSSSALDPVAFEVVEETICNVPEGGENVFQQSRNVNISGICMSTQTAIISGRFRLCIEELDDKELQYYTGYSRAQMETITTMIELHLRKNPVVICKSLHFENQVFMTLYMYRQAPEFTRLAFEMKINRGRCKLIISQWTQILYDILRNLNFWKEGQGNPNEGQYTAILDCTEIDTKTCMPLTFTSNVVRL